MNELIKRKLKNMHCVCPLGRHLDQADFECIERTPMEEHMSTTYYCRRLFDLELGRGGGGGGEREEGKEK